ncbi:MAG: hypothetical protein M0R80_05575 [Proteobacteria bacterium]|nr:hypothetical protein [Pseudomonadota bacterium]
MWMVLFGALLAAGAGSAGCHLDDSGRCDVGQTFNGSSCVSEDTDSDTSSDDGPDGGGDGGIETGMMEPCTGPDDCAEYQATFCLTQLPDSNVCLIQDCSTSPNDCPSPYLCCDLLSDLETTFGLPDSLCMPPDYWEAYSAYCVNG